MRRRDLCHAIRIVALGLIAAIPVARADPAAILQLELAPLPAEGRDDYGRFLLQALPRAFAVSAEGAWGWAAGLDSRGSAVERALSLCERWGGACRPYAVDLDVVWRGAEPSSAAPPLPLADRPGWQLVLDPRFLRHGPDRARGVYLWAHGRAAGGADSRGDQPQPHVRAFNNAGWDVLRLDRAPATDSTQAGAAWMREAIRLLRDAGYARVVAAGQSRGAWNALQMLNQPGLVDAVIAIAPAAHGPRGSPAHAEALADLAAIANAADNPAARVAVVAFEHDEYAPQPDRRAATLAALAPRVGALWLLDRPPGIDGHGGGAELAFTLRYAPCLLAFVEGGPPGCPPAAARHASASTPSAAIANAPP